jgi:TIR domain
MISNNKIIDAPKLFVSYSWSNPEHEQWVLDLATALCESGVDVILDKWHLREGQDTISFMEQMVTNPEINKVALISDEKYAKKADIRAGGVGKEAQIISKEVYDRQDQNKFVAIIPEKDENGKAFLPVYYKSRLYIDLSEVDTYSDNYEKLLRWIFDKPLYIKPEIGKRPSFLEEGEHISLGTIATFKRCLESLKNNKPNAFGAYDDYCNIFVANLERFRLSHIQGEFDDAVVTNIEEFIPFRNEAIQLFTTISQYSPTQEFAQRTHRLFENMMPYMERPEHITQYQEWDFDNFKFLIHELFLYALAIFIKYEKLNLAKYMLEQQYHVDKKSWSDRKSNMFSYYHLFRTSLRSIHYRNQRLSLNRHSLRADLLKERCKGIGIDFRYLMQADFVAFMRAEIEAKNEYCWWYPETLLYLGHFNSAFEIFARSVSKDYFNHVKDLLAIDSVKDLESLLMSYQDRSRKLPRWDFQSINPAILMGFDRLATRP